MELMTSEEGQDFLLSLPSCENLARSAIYEAGSKPSPDTERAVALILDLLIFRPDK